MSLALIPAQHTFDASQPFLRPQALAAGISDHDLASARYRQLFRGVHISAEAVISTQVRARAALLAAAEGAILSHHTAARLWGGVVPESPYVHVMLPRQLRCELAGIRVHRPVDPRRSQTFRSLPVTSAEQTFLDLAACLELVDLVVLGDSLVKKQRTTPQLLRAAARSYQGRGWRDARHAAGLVRADVDSPPETKLRLLMVLGGLPEPDVNCQIRSSDGTVRRRIDTGYPSAKLAVEYDGAYHDALDQRGPDLVRREELESDGWIFVVVVAAHLRNPAHVLARIRSATKRVGMPCPPPSDAWRAHFAVRDTYVG